MSTNAGQFPESPPRVRPSRRRGWGRLPWRSTLVTVLLAGIAAFTGARLGSERTPPGTIPLSERVYGLLGDGIELSESQREAIAAVGLRYAPIREQLRLRSRAMNVTLASLMAEEQRFGPRTDAALQELQRIMGERLKLSMEYMIEVRQLLTPEQRAVFDRRVAQEASVSR